MPIGVQASSIMTSFFSRRRAIRFERSTMSTRAGDTCWSRERFDIESRITHGTRRVTWNLIVGKNWIWVARMHGHSPEVMMKKYAKWIDQSTEEDIDAIRVALAAPARARALSAVPAVPQDALESPRTRAAPGKTWGRLSWRKIKPKTGGADGTRTRDPRRDRPVF